MSENHIFGAAAGMTYGPANQYRPLDAGMVNRGFSAGQPLQTADKPIVAELRRLESAIAALVEQQCILEGRLHPLLEQEPQCPQKEPGACGSANMADTLMQLACRVETAHSNMGSILRRLQL